MQKCICENIVCSEHEINRLTLIVLLLITNYIKFEAILFEMVKLEFSS